MGGYGAMKWALREPWRFAAAASLSGALGLSDQHGERGPGVRARCMRRVFGDGPTDGTADDVLHLVRTADPAVLPALYVACGTEDFLYGESRRLHRGCEAAGVALTTRHRPRRPRVGLLGPGIQDVLAWLPLAGPDPPPDTTKAPAGAGASRALGWNARGRWGAGTALMPCATCLLPLLMSTWSRITRGLASFGA